MKKRLTATRRQKEKVHFLRVVGKRWDLLGGRKARKKDYYWSERRKDSTCRDRKETKNKRIKETENDPLEHEKREKRMIKSIFQDNE